MTRSNKINAGILLLLTLLTIGIYIIISLSSICKKNNIEDFNQAFRLQTETHFIAFDFQEKRKKLKGSFILAKENQTKVTPYNFIAKRTDTDVYQINLCYGNKKFKAVFNGTIESHFIDGKLIIDDKLAHTLGLISLEYPITISREIQFPPKETYRYQKEVFDSVIVRSAIKYGAAKGYYKEYLIDDDQEPDYREVIKTVLKRLSMNSLNSMLSVFSSDFKEEQIQNLLLDVYEPYGDTLQKRPLLLLIHGGAFLIGDRQTKTIQFLANKKAKQG
ncbi:MAG: hypothetical protein JEZ03_08695 [Bacteroidales bacterium]|nr:hypothetical protein [Bacteroidales bacterium]